jgi:hypothetical protein
VFGVQDCDHLSDGSDEGRPSLVVFARVHWTTGSEARHRLLADVAAFAEWEGYALGKVFTAVEGLTDATHFAGVLDAVQRLDATAVLMAWPHESGDDTTDHQPWLDALRVSCAVPVLTLPRTEGA